MNAASARRWIWAALALQCVGYVVDAVWHGFVSPGVEPTTTGEMIRHLGTVHVPLYLGAASVLVATATALRAHARQSAIGVALPAALAGSLLSAGAEAWHAASHLHVDTAHAPVAGALSFIGFVVVVLAMWLSRSAGRRASETTSERRAA
jgi:hypothetical protein